MKKIVFISILALFVSATLSAQLFSYGIKAGLNYSSLAMQDITGITDGSQVYDLIQGETVRGYQVGLQTRVKVAMIFVQPELYFNVTGGSVQKVIAGGATELLDVQYNRIDIPLLVGAKFGPARVNLGPVGSAVVGTRNELEELLSTNVAGVSSGLTWGFQAGVGLDLLRKLSVDLRYEGSLSQYADNITVAGVSHNLDARPRQWILALGWWF